MDMAESNGSSTAFDINIIMANYLLPTARNLLTGQRQKIQDLTGDRLTESQRLIAEEKAQQLADKLTAKTREPWIGEVIDYEPSVAQNRD